MSDPWIGASLQTPVALWWSGNPAVTLAGVVPPPVGAFAAGTVAGVTLTGVVPAPTASFNLLTASEATLTGVVPPPVGSFTATANPFVRLTGVVPPPVGAFTMGLANMALTGIVPTPVLTATIEALEPPQITLTGVVPPPVGSFTLDEQIVLLPGDVYLFDASTGLGSISGASDQWRDGFDSTWAVAARTSTDRDVAEARLDPLTSIDPILTVSARIRVKTDLTSGSAPLGVDVSTTSGGSGYGGSFGDPVTYQIDVPGDGQIHEFQYDLIPDTTWTTVDDLFAGGAYVQAYPAGSFGNLLTIYELTVFVVTGDGEVITLTGIVPPPTAEFTLVNPPNLHLAGIVPPPVGFFDMSVPTTKSLALQVLDKTLKQAPTSVQVVVDNAPPHAILTFTIDGDTVFTATADVNGHLGQTSLPVSEAHGAAGSHTIAVTGTGGASTVEGDSDTFTLARAPSLAPYIIGVDADAVLIPEAHVGTVYHWVLQDQMPGGLGSWVMDPSPSQFVAPAVRKSIEAAQTTAQEQGQFHLFEASIGPLDWTITGYCPTQAFYNQLVAYKNLSRRIYIIDHRNRAWLSGIAGIDLKPRKRQQLAGGVFNDWAHDYVIHAICYDQNWKVPQ